MIPSSVTLRFQPRRTQLTSHPLDASLLTPCTSPLFAGHRRAKSLISNDLRTLSENTRGYTPKSEQPAKLVLPRRGSRPTISGTPSALESALTLEIAGEASTVDSPRNLSRVAVVVRLDLQPAFG